MVFNGLGLLLYLGAWLFIPTDTDGQSIVQRLVGRAGSSASSSRRRWSWSASSVLFNVVAGLEPRTGAVEVAVIALIGIAIGAALLRRREPEVAAASATSEAATHPCLPRRRWSCGGHQLRNHRWAGTSSARCSSASVCWHW